MGKKAYTGYLIEIAIFFLLDIQAPSLKQGKRKKEKGKKEWKEGRREKERGKHQGIVEGEEKGKLLLSADNEGRKGK